MKKVLFTFALGFGLLVSCSKQDEIADVTLPDVQTEQTINNGQCTTCGQYGCIDRTHDVCSICKRSRRALAGCLCGWPKPALNEDGALLIRPQEIYVKSDPVYVPVEFANRGEWLGWVMYNEPFDLYDPGDNFRVEPYYVKTDGTTVESGLKITRVNNNYTPVYYATIDMKSNGRTYQIKLRY